MGAAEMERAGRVGADEFNLQARGLTRGRSEISHPLGGNGSGLLRQPQR